MSICESRNVSIVQMLRSVKMERLSGSTCYRSTVIAIVLTPELSSILHTLFIGCGRISHTVGLSTFSSLTGGHELVSFCALLRSVDGLRK